MIAVGNGKSVHHRFRSFGTVEVKAHVLVVLNTATVDNATGRSVFAADGNGLALKINIAVSITGVCTIPDNNRLTIAGDINRSPDVVEIRWTIVIDVDSRSPNNGAAEYY
jgi:hypothetical protein